MPTAPGLVPDRAPSTLAPNVGLEVPVDAFGGAVGKALEGLGTSIEGASDKIWQRAMDLQNLNNETAAKKADADYMMKSGMLHADFVNKEGMNAGPEALQAHIKELQDLREQVAKDNNLNQMSSKMYDSSSLSFMGRNIFNAAGHSGQQMKVESNKASNSRIDMAQRNMGLYATDEVSVQRATRVIEDEVDQLGKQGGWSPDTIENTKQQKISEGIKNRILGIADNHGALAAQGMLNDAIKNGKIDTTTADQVQNTVDRKINEQGSRSITDKVLTKFRNGEENKPEQEYINDAVKEVKDVKNLTDDQRQGLEDKTRTSVQTAYRQQKSVVRDQQYQDYQTVTKALDTPNAEGRFPTTMDQIQLDPEVKTALDRMRPTQIQAISRKLLSNAMDKTVVPTPENQQRYQTLMGMAHEAPDEFLATPLYEENIPKFQRDQLRSIQNQLTKQAALDPGVTKAVSYFNNTGVLKNAGIDKKNDPEAYYNFVGALQDAIATFRTDNKRTPKSDELDKIGNHLLQQEGISKGWLWDSKTALYKTDVPEEDDKRIRSDPYWKNTNQRPSDQQIHNFYVREQYNKLFKGSAGASKAAIVPGTVSSPVSE